MTVGPHLSTEAISDLLEGLLPDDEARAAEEHVASCAECSSTRAALVQVHDLLESQPAVAPMPDHVAARIEEGLAAESRARSQPATESVEAAAAPAAGEESAPSKSGRGGLLSRLGLAELLGGRGPRLVVAAAAALAVLGGAGAIAVQVTQDTNSDRNVTAGGDNGSGNGKSGGESVGADAGPKISSKKFGSDVGGLVAQERPAAAQSATQNSAPAADPNGPDTVRANAKQRQCAADLLADLDAGQLAQAQLARLDGQPVVIAVTEAPGEGVVRAYAVTGCPGGSPEVVQQQNVEVPR